MDIKVIILVNINQICVINWQLKSRGDKVGTCHNTQWFWQIYIWPIFIKPTKDIINITL